METPQFLRNQFNFELAWHVTHAGLVARLASLMAAAARLALKVFASAEARSSVGVLLPTHGATR